MHWSGFHDAKYDSQGIVLDLSNLLSLVLAAVSQVADAYAMVGCTDAV